MCTLFFIDLQSALRTTEVYYDYINIQIAQLISSVKDPWRYNTDMYPDLTPSQWLMSKKENFYLFFFLAHW
jgi:hypothetical protein